MFYNFLNILQQNIYAITDVKLYGSYLAIYIDYVALVVVAIIAFLFVFLYNRKFQTITLGISLGIISVLGLIKVIRIMIDLLYTP
jgi:hypothetical protein